MTPKSPALWTLTNVPLITPGAETRFPRLVTPVEDDDLATYLSQNLSAIEAAVDEHGAVLFRGFAVETERDFEEVAALLCPRLESNYGDLVKRASSDLVYDATWYPNDLPILFHNEGSHTSRIPRRQSFFCQLASARGGETPIVDSRLVYDRMRPLLRQEFEDKGLVYYRNFIPGLDISWQKFFRTEVKAQVESTCRGQGIEVLWKPNGALRISTRAPAVIRHPSGRPSFCNQILLHHIAALDQKTSAALQALLPPEDLPRNVCFGDGSPIPSASVEEVMELTTATAVRFEWHTGDVIFHDNLAVAHARCPFEGKREIRVALGDVVDMPGLAWKAPASRERVAGGMHRSQGAAPCPD
jgi:alpha-ketoglutarate-dependent taurine dioxygenase